MKSREHPLRGLARIGLGLVLTILMTFTPLPSGWGRGGVGDLQAAPVQNLLANPDFEGGFYAWQGDGEVVVADGWQPWFVQPSEPPCYKFRPHYQGAAPYANRIHSGSNAQQYYTLYASHIAGIYQQVSAPAGAIVRFTIWGQSWTAPENGDPNHSDTNNTMHLRIGIDPDGDTNPFSPAIVWSGENSAFDAYAQFRVEAIVGNAGRVTVFTYSNPTYCLANNNVYWDDASLTVIGQAGPTPAPTRTPGPTNTPGPSPTPRPTQPPTATFTPGAGGQITYIVQEGDTLSGIALKFGTTVAELQRLNGLGNSTLIYAGQELIVGEVAVTPTPTAVPASDTPAILPSPTAPPPTATPVPGGGICVSAFDDTNGNGLREAGEGLVAGATLEVLQGDQPIITYETVGSGEPHCFAELAAGSYTVKGQPPEGSRATTSTEWSLALVGRRNESVSLGVTRSAAATPQTSPQASAGLLQQLGLSLWRASGILVLLAALGIAGFIYLSRRT